MNDYLVSINSSKFEIRIIDEKELNFGEEIIKYELIKINGYTYCLKLNERVYQLTAEKQSNELFRILSHGYYLDVIVRTALQEKAYKLLENAKGERIHHNEIKAPMPGLILKIKKSIGDKVEKGDSVIILEAMKMENDLRATTSGVVEQIFVTEGSPVEKGAKLFSIG